MKESTLDIKRVGNYTTNWAYPENCKVCHNADYGDVLIEGICGKCLLSALKPFAIEGSEWGNIVPDRDYPLIKWDQDSSPIDEIRAKFTVGDLRLATKILTITGIK